MKACFSLTGNASMCAEMAEVLPTKLQLDFAGHRLMIAATSEHVVRNLRRVYRYFAEPGTMIPSNRLVLLEAESREATEVARRLGRSPRQLDGHLLLSDWFAWGLRIASPTLLHYYASKLTRLWVADRWEATTATLHAASLCDEVGGGLLLIGEAAAGKTTLTLRLLDEGFRFCSDDTSCIRRSDLICVPFPMAFVLRAPAGARPIDGSGRAERPPDILLLDEPRWLEERWESVGTAFRPQALYFLDRRPNADILRPLRKADAALKLLHNLIMALGADAEESIFAERNFDLACGLADSARCAEVDSTDIDSALGAILRDYQGLAAAGETL